MKTELDNGLLSNTIISTDVRIQYRNNEEYIGEVINGNVREGWGIFKYSNGDVYEGYFKNGVREGKGEYKYKDGSIYRGEWVNDMKNGFGSFQVAGKEFDGVWENDNLKEGMIYKINGVKINDNLIEKIMEEENIKPKKCNLSSFNKPKVTSPYRTPIKSVKSSYNNHITNEFKIESPKRTPESIKASNVYKDKNFYEKDYREHINSRLDNNLELPEEHDIDIELLSCNFEDKRITKVINRILQKKNEDNFHYESCKGSPCLCSNIQTYIWK